jgi:putative endopeptidase
VDSTIKPGDNFYLYVNGKWIKNHEIPVSQNGIGGFTDLYYSTQDTLHKILDSLSGLKLVSGTIEQKVGDFYASGMDSLTINRRGFEPLKPWLEKVSAIRDAAGVMSYAAGAQEMMNILYTAGVGPDDKNSSRNVVQFSQGGLGLPNRDNYFKKDSANLKVIQAYKEYIETLFKLTGDDSLQAAWKMEKVYGLEKRLAESHKTTVQLRDPQSNYHVMPVSKLDKQMPEFSWSSTLKMMGIQVDTVILRQPAFYSRVNSLLKSENLENWKAYLQFHTINAMTAYLSDEFDLVSFNFYGRALSGVQERKPRWTQITNTTDNNLGEGLGEIYVNQYFSREAKTRMLTMVNNLQTAFEKHINQLDWMSESTKSKARDKLQAFIKKIGFPDTWRDYSGVSIDKQKYFENRISCLKNENRRQLAKIGKPVDKLEWDMTPPTINAGYDPSLNVIAFPAGILQPPFFDPAADDAVNYGAIGMVIGHEITHGFDDQGAQYDKDGNLKNWWSREDSIKFNEKTKQVILQFNRFVAVDTFHVNGALTNGENIADLGGLSIAYDAFKLTKQGRDTIRIDGLLPDERFFLSFATIWRSRYKDELSRQLVATDPHAPDRFRVIGPLQNFDPFYITFHVQKGDSMYKPEAERIKIW